MMHTRLGAACSSCTARRPSPSTWPHAEDDPAFLLNPAPSIKDVSQLQAVPSKSAWVERTVLRDGRGNTWGQPVACLACCGRRRLRLKLPLESRAIRPGPCSRRSRLGVVPAPHSEQDVGLGCPPRHGQRSASDHSLGDVERWLVCIRSFLG